MSERLNVHDQLRVQGIKVALTEVKRILGIVLYCQHLSSPGLNLIKDASKKIKQRINRRDRFSKTITEMHQAAQE